MPKFFISAEANTKQGSKILGFVRLRLPKRSIHQAITESSALIRELHVYGQSVAIGRSDDTKTQHKGVGKMLMAKAEEIAREHKRDKILVISGVGVRGYYRKLGYDLEDSYMVKNI